MLKEFFSDAVIYGFGGILFRSAQIFILPIIFIYLDKEQFGRLDYFLNIKNILIVITGWGILTAIFKYSDINHRKSKTPFNGLLVILTISGLILVLYLMFAKYFLVNDEYYQNIAMAIVISTFGATISVPQSIFRYKNKPSSYVMLNMVFITLYMVLSFVFIEYMNYGYRSFLYGQIIAAIITSVCGIIATSGYIEYTYDHVLFMKMLKFGFSILLNSLAFVLIYGMTRFVVKIGGSFAEVGILGMSQKISLIVGSILVMPFNLAWLPFVKNNYDNDHFHELVNKIFRIFITVGLFLSFSTQLLVTDFFNLIQQYEYIDSAKYVYIFNLSFVAQGLFFMFSAGIFIRGKTKYYSIIAISTVLLNIGLYIIFRNNISIMVAACITLLTFTFMAILAYVYGNNIIKINIYDQKTTLVIFIYTVLFILLLANVINNGVPISLKIFALTVLLLVHITLELYYEKKTPIL